LRRGGSDEGTVLADDAARWGPLGAAGAAMLAALGAVTAGLIGVCAGIADIAVIVLMAGGWSGTGLASTETADAGSDSGFSPESAGRPDANTSR